jgi:iron complex outermembrane recepter protein
VGGRLEGFSEDGETRSTIIPLMSTSESVASQDDEALTVRTGLVYDLSDQLSGYFNYSTGFTPQSASSQDPEAGGPFDPERGRLFEVGTKADLFNESVFLSLAAYQINKTNILVADPTPGAPTGSVAEVGEARSRGLELDIVGDITEDWTFTFSYALNDTIIQEGAESLFIAVGDEFVNAPDQQLGFWTRYDIDAINSAIAFGGQYVSEQVSFSGQRVKPFEVFDASWTTNWENIQFQVNVRNLFDKVYAESGFLQRTGHFPGEPRTVRAEVTLRY